MVPEFVRLGHTVNIAAWFGLQGAPQNWAIYKRHDKKVLAGTVTVYPAQNSQYGIAEFVPIAQMTGSDVIISCMDVWVIPPEISRQASAFTCWCPIDHDPLPNGIRGSMQPAIYPMVQTQWGVEVCAKAGIEAHYIPCSAPADVFYPGDKAAARKALEIPEGVNFVASMVAANKDPSDRKGFGEALQGFAKFAQKHPDSILYVHTNWHGPINIAAIAERLGIQDKVARPNDLAYNLGIYKESYLRNVYQASDVLLNPAKSEGFCIPYIESQLCGTPIMATDFSSTRELLFAGWALPGQLNWSMGADSWRMLAYVDGIADALEECYNLTPEQRTALSNDARKGALPFDDERVAKDYWKPALDSIEKALGASKLHLVTF